MTTYVLRYCDSGRPILVEKSRVVAEEAQTHFVQPDFEPYESPIDGTVVSGRRARRYDLERSNSREYEGRASEMRAAAEYRADKDRALSRKLIDRMRWVNA